MGDWDGDSQQDLVSGEQLVLSASSVTTFLRCGLQWEFAYVQKIRRPPTIRQALGLASHSAYEEDMLVKLTSGVNAPEDVVLDVFSDEYNEMHRAGFGVVGDADPEEAETDAIKAKDRQIGVIQKQHREIASRIVPVLVEESFIYTIEGIPYSGTLDLFDAEGKLRDWKNVAKKPSGTGIYNLGMIGYAVGYRHLSGAMEKEVQLDFLVRYKKKEPGYFPISSGGPISNEAISSFASVVERVYTSIMKGDFVPNGIQNGACSWCGYFAICPAVKN